MAQNRLVAIKKDLPKFGEPRAVKELKTKANEMGVNWADVLGWKGWNIAKTEQERRNLIRTAIKLHKYKGTTISIKMAIAEGWFTRKASKWHTMYEQMLSYRAASFFSRVHCPEVSIGGMLTTDEAQETIDTDYTESSSKPAKKSAIETLNETIASAPETQKMNIQDVDVLPDNKEPFDEL